MTKLGARRPVLSIVVVLAAALGGGALAMGLRPSAGTDTFVSRSSASFRATEDDHQHFGGDAVIVLIRESLPNLVETKDLATVSELEACLGGQVLLASQQLQSFTPAPAGSQAPYGGYASPCAKLMRSEPVQVVYGPGTFLNRAVGAVNVQVQGMLSAARQRVTSASRAAYQLALADHLGARRALVEANAASQLAQQQATQQLEQLYLQSGIAGVPRIDNPQFIPQIVFDQTRGVNQPKARFAYLFPSPGSALIQVRLKASLTDAQQASAISLIRQAVRMPIFRSAYGGAYTVTGAPVVVSDLAAQITGSIGILLVAAVLVMAATLLVVFRSPQRPARHPASPNGAGGESSGYLRLLPLVIALIAALITFGLTALAGATLTLASIAVLPILIGLAVDYAIQFQSRAQEARADQGSPAEEPLRADQAVARAAVAGAPTITAAALATATGFLVLLLSPVPMVRGFGVLLVVGIAVALAGAMSVGSAAMVLSERLARPRARVVWLVALGASVTGAREILGDLGRRAAKQLRRHPSPTWRSTRAARGPIRGRSSAVLGWAAARPGRVLAVGAALAALGWIADTQMSVQSDVTKLVPPNMPALRNLHTLERITGVSGEIDVTIKGSDVTRPRTVGWMIAYQQALLRHYGYLETQGCARATLCPALSLPDLFSAGTSASQRGGSLLSRASIAGLLAAVPSYFSQAVITADHREATLAFGIRLMALSRQQRVIDYMSSQLRPPAGVTAQLTGLPVLAAQANAALSSSGRRLLTLLAGLLAVGLVLLAVFRSLPRALIPLIPIVLATGWSALVVFALGIPLNPLSATLGTLVIAISTEFSVLLSERFRQERTAGHAPAAALARTYRSTGAAVLASGITAITGFGVLVLSNITMLSDFGFVTLVDLSVSLAGVLLVLPAVLVLSERRRVPGLASALTRRAGRTTRMRRPPRVA
ncbi:MAG: MMPL family transporter [Solirubrobacteraceae bacterium]